MFTSQLRIFLIASFAIVYSACQSSSDSDFLPIQLDTPGNAETILSYYFGSYTTKTDGSPREASLLQLRDGQAFVNLKALNAMGFAQLLADTNNDGMIDWDELEPFLVSTYYKARNFPATLEAFYQETGEPGSDNAWMEVSLDGMMVSARRQIYVKNSAVEAALLSYKKNDNQILYPIGTTFIAHHSENDQLIETTISQKRHDAFWDYAIYDQDGNLTSTTKTGPKELTTPTRCTGCHFGSKQFEPEASFPNPAPDGPFGPRGIYVGEEAKDMDIATFFDEHARRSDTVLGVYGTIYVSRLKAKGDRLTDEEKDVLNAVGL